MLKKNSVHWFTAFYITRPFILKHIYHFVIFPLLWASMLIWMGVVEKNSSQKMRSVSKLLTFARLTNSHTRHSLHAETKLNNYLEQRGSHELVDTIKQKCFERKKKKMELNKRTSSNFFEYPSLAFGWSNFNFSKLYLSICRDELQKLLAKGLLFFGGASSVSQKA